MTIRKMLESAAKAAGIDIKFFVDKVTDYDSPHYGISAIQFGNTWETWNPLEDDGDAFRLMVSLASRYGPMVLSLLEDCVEFGYIDAPYGDECLDENPCGSTRRAIVFTASMIWGEQEL